MSGGARRRGRSVLAVLLLAASVTPAGAGADPAPSTWRDTAPTEGTARASTTDLDRWIHEASRRFGVPTTWIRAVIAAESAYDPHARSPAGAQGLMQLMPGTYAELSARHGLGPDAFAPRDNILAGGAYLRLLHDRFGPNGMFPAYNAGPARYAAHLRDGRPLPAETRLYERRVRRLLARGTAAEVPAERPRTPPSPLPEATDPLAAPLFVRRARPASPEPGRYRARLGKGSADAEAVGGSW